MAYTPDTLSLVVSGVEGRAPNIWTYSTSDGDGTITGAGYFSDGDAKGMKKGDLVDAVVPGTPKYKKYQVSSVTAGGAATVAAPTAIT